VTLFRKTRMPDYSGVGLGGNQFDRIFRAPASRRPPDLATIGPRFTVSARWWSGPREALPLEPREPKAPTANTTTAAPRRSRSALSSFAISLGVRYPSILSSALDCQKDIGMVIENKALIQEREEKRSSVVTFPVPTVRFRTVGLPARVG